MRHWWSFMHHGKYFTSRPLPFSILSLLPYHSTLFKNYLLSLISSLFAASTVVAVATTYCYCHCHRYLPLPIVVVAVLSNEFTICLFFICALIFDGLGAIIVVILLPFIPNLRLCLNMRKRSWSLAK